MGEKLTFYSKLSGATVLILGLASIWIYSSYKGMNLMNVKENAFKQVYEKYADINKDGKVSDIEKEILKDDFLKYKEEKVKDMFKKREDNFLKSMGSIEIAKLEAEIIRGYNPTQDLYRLYLKQSSPLEKISE